LETFFHPDILTERDARIAAEIEKAGQVSPVERERVASKYKLIADNYAEMPLEYLEFKENYHEMSKRADGFAQQAKMIQFCQKCIEQSDYDAINNFLSFMITRREETSVREVVQKKILSHITDGSSTGSESLDLLVKYGANNRSSMGELVDKYISCVPDLSQRMNGIQMRKEHLQETLQNYVKKWPEEGGNILTNEDLAAMQPNKDMFDERMADFLLKTITSKTSPKEFNLTHFYEYATYGKNKKPNEKEQKYFDQILNTFYTLKDSDPNFMSYDDLSFDTPNILRWRLYTNDRFSVETRDDEVKQKLMRRQGMYPPNHPANHADDLFEDEWVEIM